MRRLAILTAIGVPLLLPAAGAAGGWAALEVASKPTDVRPGEVWHARMTVREHGVTLASGLEPSVTIRRASGGKRTTYAASPTGRPGIYEARVVFPGAGTWRYEIDDGFGGIHEFAPVSIGSERPQEAAAPTHGAAEPPPAGAARSPQRDEGGDEVGSAVPMIGAGALLAGILAAAALARRRGRKRQASVA
jgi:hypothetical protein